MQTKLSRLQRWILEQTYRHGGELEKARIMASYFGLSTRDRRSSKLGWQLVVDRQQLPIKTYAAAAMSMNRSLKRLMERGLIVSSNALHLEGKFAMSSEGTALCKDLFAKSDRD